METKIPERDVKFISIQFTNLQGKLRNMEYTRSAFEEIKNTGTRFDGSSLGFATVQESDLILLPEESTFQRFPWNRQVGRVFATVAHPNQEAFQADPRRILMRVSDNLREEGFLPLLGPELEFYLLNNGEVIDDATYASTEPYDKGASFRRTLVDYAKTLGVSVELHHHEVGPGQEEIELDKSVQSVNQADNVQTCKLAANVLAAQQGVDVQFMPKIEKTLPGNGMHCHISLIDKESKEPVLFDGREVSQIGRRFIAGLLEHAQGMSAILTPSINSYKRLIPGYEAPVFTCWGRHNRSAMIRIPPPRGTGVKYTIEYRSVDAQTNPYLCFALLLAAGLDGIERELAPPPTIEENVYDMPAEEREAQGIEALPTNLNEAIDAMQEDAFIQEVLGDQAFKAFVKNLRRQWKAYTDTVDDPETEEVTKWERKKYGILS